MIEREATEPTSVQPLSGTRSKGLRGIPRTSIVATIVIVAASSLSMLLRVLTPLWLILYGLDDDQLYVRLGHSLLSGWLGPFDQRTLEKPPGFPAFIAFTRMTHLPFLFLEQALHLAAAGALAYAVFRVTSQRCLGLWLYVILALDPSYLGAGASRVARDNWYSSVCLLLFAVAVAAMPRALRSDTFAAGRGKRWHPVVVGLVGGVLLTSYWLGRPEHPWLLPSLGILVGSGIVMRWRLPPPSFGQRARTYMSRLLLSAPIAVSFLVAFALFVGLVAGVEFKNRQRYGAFIADDFASGQFVRMYDVWQSVHAGPARRYVPIGGPQRAAVYKVSSAARELEPFLDTPARDRPTDWVSFGCTQYGICDDFAAGWLPYALRDATVSAGHFGTEAAAQEFWSRVGGEIATACRKRILSCAKPMPSLFPSPSRVSEVAWFHATLHAFVYLAQMRQADTARPLSVGPEGAWILFRNTINGLPTSLASQQVRESESKANLRRLQLVGDAYGWALPFGFPLACCGYVMFARRRPERWTRLWLIGVAAGLAVLVRVTLLGLLDSTSFRGAADAPNYQMPGSSFILVFVASGVFLLFASARGRHMGPSGEKAKLLGGLRTESPSSRSETGPEPCR